MQDPGLADTATMALVLGGIRSALGSAPEAALNQDVAASRGMGAAEGAGRG